MKDVRGWIERKLGESGFTTKRQEKLQLQVSRPSMTDAHVLCIGLEDGESVDQVAIDNLLQQVPEAGFIAVVPTRIDHSAYERAEERGICVGGLGELVNALHNDEDLRHHVDSQEQYERRRLRANRAVESLKRKGHHAYEVRRRGGLRPLRIATTNDYEFTAERLYWIMEEYEDVRLELIVVTNPNCRGLSTDSTRASAQVGVPVVLFQDLLDGLGSRWT